MKKTLSRILSVLLLAASLSAPAVAASDRLKLSAGSTLTLINANEYVTGICGTITAEKLALEFAGDVTFTSPTGEILTGDAMVPSDTVVSNGTDSKKILIYGDVDRNAKLGIGDVIAILKYVAGWDVDICEKAIDLNWDKNCDISDATLLIRRIAGQNVCIGIDINPTQITLSYYDSDCTRLGVLWHSPKKTHNPAVQVVKGDTDDFSEARTILGYTSSGVSGYNSRAVIDGLEFGQTYSYRVGDASGFWSSPASFTVRDEDTEEFTFVCFTDSQSKDSDSGKSFRSAWKSALTLFPETEIALHCGDIVESVNSGSWSNMLDPSAEYLRRIPTMVISGNHETSYAGTSGVKIQYDHFYTDMPEQASVVDGYFYSFNYGNAHFVMLNTNKQDAEGLSDEQLTWLKRDLEQNTAKWTLVLMHHPMYSTGCNSTDRWQDSMMLAMQAQLSPIFAEHGVDMVLAGHDHVYYCTYPIDGECTPLTESTSEIIDGTVYYTSPKGVIYTTPGCTGSSSRSLYSDHDKSYYRQTAENMTATFLTVKVRSDRLTVNFCAPSGYGTTSVYDSWGIIK